MKALKTGAFFLFLLLTIHSLGDIIITEKHTQNIQQITNLSEYPDVTLFAVYKYEGLPQSKNMGAAKIAESGLIRKHAFAPLEIFAVKNSYLKTHSENDIDWKDSKNVIKSNLIIAPNSKETDVEGVSLLEHFYTIMGFCENAMVIHEAKNVTNYEANAPQSVEYFDYKGDKSKLRKTFN